MIIEMATGHSPASVAVTDAGDLAGALKPSPPILPVTDPLMVEPTAEPVIARGWFGAVLADPPGKFCVG